MSWNPSVRSDCSNIQPGLYYCVAITDTPTTRTEPVPTALPGGSSLPTQTGIVAGCTRYWIVSRTDTCDSIISAAGIAASDFHTWNPAVGADCSSLLPDYYVCVSTGPQEAPPTSTVTFGGDGTGTTSLTATTTAASSGSESGSETGTTTTPATPITSPTDPVTTPTPYMPGMVSGCVRFYFRGPEAADLFCYDLAAAAGVSLA